MRDSTGTIVTLNIEGYHSLPIPKPPKDIRPTLCTKPRQPLTLHCPWKNAHFLPNYN